MKLDVFPREHFRATVTNIHPDERNHDETCFRFAYTAVSRYLTTSVDCAGKSSENSGTRRGCAMTPTLSVFSVQSKDQFTVNVSRRSS